MVEQGQQRVKTEQRSTCVCVVRLGGCENFIVQRFDDECNMRIHVMPEGSCFVINFREKKILWCIQYHRSMSWRRCTIPYILVMTCG